MQSYPDGTSDAASSSCRAFTYTGIKGNENNFLTLADCRRACPAYARERKQSTTALLLRSDESYLRSVLLQRQGRKSEQLSQQGRMRSSLSRFASEDFAKMMTIGYLFSSIGQSLRRWNAGDNSDGHATSVQYSESGHLSADLLVSHWI
ncbi:unnamed protein product [Sphagnum jensenii]